MVRGALPYRDAHSPGKGPREDANPSAIRNSSGRRGLWTGLKAERKTQLSGFAVNFAG